MCARSLTENSRFVAFFFFFFFICSFFDVVVKWKRRIVIHDDDYKIIIHFFLSFSFHSKPVYLFGFAGKTTATYFAYPWTSFGFGNMFIYTSQNSIKCNSPFILLLHHHTMCDKINTYSRINSCVRFAVCISEGIENGEKRECVFFQFHCCALISLSKSMDASSQTIAGMGKRNYAF